MTPCQGLTCGTGGNSPYTNIFPVNGLSATGTCNQDHIQLVPDSLHSKNCTDGATLTTDDSQTRLVGKKNGSVVCEHDALVNASFKVRSGGAPVELTIASVQQITDGAHSFEGYRIMHGKDEKSACDYAESLVILKDLGFSSTAPPDDPLSPPGAEGLNADFAIVMGGPIYDIFDASLVKGEASGFFNLACVGDALAKTAFYDLTDKGKAALRMITAKYATARSYTVRGMTIDWRKFHTTDQPPPTEAKWNADGKVLCLRHPRLVDLRDSQGQSVPAEQLPVQPAGCGSNGQPPGTCDQQHWIENLQQESNGVGSDCDSIQDNVVLQSWSDPSGKLILTPKNQPPVTSPQPASAPTNRDPAATP